MEIYVVATDFMGSSSHATSNGDGTLTEQSELVLFNSDGRLSYSNGIGDFDSDGEYDFMVARGSYAGIVYFFGKVGPGNDFVQKDIGSEWIGAMYPGGMAIADFNEDGHLDFIMTYYDSVRCDLFKGDGNLSFEVIRLNSTAPNNSLGADAADFNADGHADFVVFPYASYDDFYVNLGDGAGSFTTVKNKCYREGGYWDVSAADFNNDGFADLAASYHDLIDIYFGIDDGIAEGKFKFQYRITDRNMYMASVDNYDFDGDGNQDLVIGGYEVLYGYKGIAVMRGDGKGQFGEPFVSGSASLELQMISTIAAPPLPELEPNREPIAVIRVNDSDLAATQKSDNIVDGDANLVVTAGQDIYVDGLDSYDEDGEIASYRWDFGDGLSAGEATAYHVYYDTGTYTITLTVTDDKGATGSAQFTIEVEAVTARMRVVPRTLNLESKGRWMYAFVKLPEGCDPTQVDVTAVQVVIDGSPMMVDFGNSKRDLVVKTNRWMAKRNKFYLKFDRQALIDKITDPENKTVIRIEGEVFSNGGYVDFSSEDTIRTIKPGKKKSKPYWKNKRHSKKTKKSSCKKK
jgi:hypothetical protein